MNKKWSAFLTKNDHLYVDFYLTHISPDTSSYAGALKISEL